MVITGIAVKLDLLSALSPLASCWIFVVCHNIHHNIIYKCILRNEKIKIHTLIANKFARSGRLFSNFSSEKSYYDHKEKCVIFKHLLQYLDCICHISKYVE